MSTTNIFANLTPEPLAADDLASSQKRPTTWRTSNQGR